MRIEHVAYWVNDLENMRSFYENYFDGESGVLYHNPEKDFKSYFITFDSGGRIELMHNPKIANMPKHEPSNYPGITHIAFSVGSKEKVDKLTERLRSDGYQVVGEPRTTGDGYYESVVLDPESNYLEITE